jgi:hypothetical protein
VSHSGRFPEERSGDLSLEHVGQPVRAGDFMSEQGWRTLSLWPMHFANPDGNALTKSSRGSLNAPITPFQILNRMMEKRLLIQAVQVRR